jgi:Mrp family chromosome partitioning ATPase
MATIAPARNRTTTAVADGPKLDVVSGELAIADDDMIALYAGLGGAVLGAHRTLGVISTLPGEGVSTIARGLSRAAAMSSNRRVLLCEVGATTARVAGGRSSLLPAVIEWSSGQIELGEKIAWLPGGRVAFGALAGPDWLGVLSSDVQLMQNVVALLTACFDLVIFDLPAASSGVTGPALARVMDGVVLVVEAERTRGHAVAATRKTIESYGGLVLGAVLNKRRHHIPEFLYRLL